MLDLEYNYECCFMIIKVQQYAKTVNVFKNYEANAIVVIFFTKFSL